MDARELLEGLREFAAWGTVDADGKKIDQGSGNWSSVKQGTGHYLITVDGSFGGQPTVVASGYRLAPGQLSLEQPKGEREKNYRAQDNIYSSHVFNKEAFEVHSYDIAGHPDDGAFSFIAIWRL